MFYGDIPAILHPTWNEPVEDSRATGVFNRDFFGGDLQGVKEKLDYLKSLGVDAIWLTPIFMARSNHRYDTDDYLHVDPALGGDAAFAALSAAAKARGIRLILDGVFNHASSDSRYFDRYHRYPDASAPASRRLAVPELVRDHRQRRAVHELRRLRGPRLAAGRSTDANAGVRDFLFRGPTRRAALDQPRRGRLAARRGAGDRPPLVARLPHRGQVLRAGRAADRRGHRRPGRRERRTCSATSSTAS